MRLALLIYGSLETVSGGFIYDRHLVRHLTAWGHQVEVISLPWRSYGRSLLDNFSPRLMHRLRRGTWEMLLQDELAHPSLFWLNRRLRTRAAYPIIAIVHHLKSREVRPAWQNWGFAWVERQYLTAVDGYVCVSRTSREDVMRLAGNSRPVVVATPGADGLPGDLGPGQIAARALASGPLQIIFAANLIPRKELHTLLAALARLPRADWRLKVAGSLSGDPAYVQAVRRQIEDLGLAPQVVLLGSLTPEELAGHLMVSQVLAVPSSYEGFGIIYLEAMRFGLPAIASTAGAAREIITPGRNGFLAPPGDAGALAQSLSFLMQNRGALKTMSLAAYQDAGAHPTWEESGEGVRHFLEHFGK